MGDKGGLSQECEGRVVRVSSQLGACLLHAFRQIFHCRDTSDGYACLSSLLPQESFICSLKTNDNFISSLALGSQFSLSLFINHMQMSVWWYVSLGILFY